ncbi:MAG TPA: PH domain-containing protein [Gaiellaceae bacterium]|nr:PH domain-containing protein [Gaiellaceae bacterium]
MAPAEERGMPQVEPGEEVRLDARPHGIALVQPLLRPLAVVGAGLVLIAVGQEYWIAGIAGAVLLGLGALLAFRAVLRWDRTRLLLTSTKLTVVYGVARRRSASVALASAPALEFEQGILGRLFGYGTLIAGDFEVPYVPDARRIRKLVS